MRRHLLVAALLISVGLPVTAHAQGVVSGLVTDGRRPLPGVAVTATTDEAADSLPRRAVTDAAGRYRIDGLDPARRHTLLFALPGFSVIMRPNVDVSGAGTTVDVTLRVGPLAESLIVPGPFDTPGPRLQPAVPGRACLHDTNETAVEAQRRTEALVAMRLISSIVADAAVGAPRLGSFPAWDALAGLPAVAVLRNGSGPAAEVARRIDWGGAEPLPGWGIAYVTTRTDVRFALTDLRDPCGFSYSSTDPQVIPPSFGRILPLT